MYASRWRALPEAVARALRPTPEPALGTAAEWVLARESGGWAVRPGGALDGAPTYFTADIPADDQNAAFDWAREITPTADQKAIPLHGAAAALTIAC
ncbi:hypothetical protein ACGFNP_13985 [Nonomuraea sp. NPDC049269]|uniref:hypothetical protein n=1 Tax=Nonomuraea sp. NPDC049269 TaxID=3364349 RepID=UPI00371122AA